MPTRARGYAPQFDLDLKRGEIGEDLTEALLTDAMQTEVKTQLRALQYGSVFVETEVRGRLDGIRHPAKTADWWAFVIGRDGATPERIIFVRATNLAHLVDRIEATRGLSEAPSGSHPGRGARVYLDELVGLEQRPGRPAPHPVRAPRPRRSLRPRGARTEARG
jgi:hypothetical protein